MVTPKVLVTTTPTLEGWEIEAYLGPVFSHIVAGTGFFSDFAASFSDIFGGRSQTYQNQLSAINLEAIELLKNKVSMLGGNLLLGLRIDQDEISGKAKQMFMITASGTAARGIQKLSQKSTQRSSLFLTSDKLETELKKIAITQKCNSIPITLNDDEWNFLIENQVYEIASKVLLSLQQTPEQFHFPDVLSIRRKYFLALPVQNSISILYDWLLNNDQELFTFIRDIVFQGDLFDFDGLFTLLNSVEFERQKWALSLAKANKSYYTPDDIGKFTKLLEMIKSTFVIRAKFFEEKSKLTSSVKQKWLCECGTKNNKDDTICSSCHCDLYGFYVTEPKPVEVMKFIQNKVGVLQTYFQ